MRKKTLKKNGFTLAELMIAVIIIGILVGIAMPLYLKQAEQAMGSKALENMQSIFNAEMAYMADHESYTGLISELQRYAPVTDDDGDWTYAIGAGAITFTITATRRGGRFNGQSISLDQDTTITGSWPWPP